MAEKKFSLEGFDLRSGGINDLPELAVEPHSNTAKPPEGVQASLEKAEVALAIEEETTTPTGTSQKGFLGFIGKVRSTLPIIARVLPLLDSGIASALAPVTSALVPQNQSSKAIERSVADMQSSQRDLRSQVQNQNLQLKRVEEQLVRIREEVDHRNREQLEKIEEIRSSTRTAKIIGVFVLLLLLVVLGLQGWILFRLHH